MSQIDIETLTQRTDYCTTRGTLVQAAPKPGSTPVVGTDTGKPFRVIDTGGSLAVEIDGETFSLAKAVFARVHGRMPASQLLHLDGDPFNTRVTNLVERDAATGDQLAQIEAAKIARKRKREDEEARIRERELARQEAHQRAVAARNAREEQELAIGRAETLRRSGASTGTVAVAQAIEADEADARLADDPAAGVVPYDPTATFEPLPPADPSRHTMPSARKPRIQIEETAS